QVDAALEVLDRGLALALMDQSGADLAAQRCDALEVLLAAVVLEAVAPQLQRRVDAAEAERRVALLLRDPRSQLSDERPVEVARGLVVRERLVVRVDDARRVAGGLEEAQRLGVDALQLRGGQARLAPQRRG